MSSGPRGEEPIDLSLNLRQHYARQLREHGCQPRCADCRQAQGALIAAGVSIREPPERTRRLAATWEPVEVLLFAGLLIFSLACVALTGGRR